MERHYRPHSRTKISAHDGVLRKYRRRCRETELVERESIQANHSANAALSRQHASGAGARLGHQQRHQPASELERHVPVAICNRCEWTVHDGPRCNQQSIHHSHQQQPANVLPPGESGLGRTPDLESKKWGQKDGTEEMNS